MRVIGIDIGGSNVRGVVWNGARVVRAVDIKTPGSAVAFTKALRALRRSLDPDEHIARIGIGCAGVIEKSVVVESPNIRFLKRFDLAKVFPRGRVRVDNDARTFARAEYARGAAKGAARALFFTFGTGVGRAVGDRGTVEKIKRFEYPERWEPEYQKVRRDAALAPFLAAHLISIIKRYKPSAIVVGGAVAERRGFVPALRNALCTHGFKGEVWRAKFSALAGAIGAALLAQ